MTTPSLLVLAGGFGTRLRAAVGGVPKPMAPVGDQPFLGYLVGQWAAQGVKDFTFLLHYEAAVIEAYLDSLRKNGGYGGCTFRAVTEATPLGTGGAIAFAVREVGLNDSFLVANADTWLASGIQQVSRTSPPAIAVLRTGNTERYGSVEMEKNKVVAFREKQNSSGPGWINAGLYHLHAAFFQSWDGRPFSLERDLFPVLAGSGKLTAVPLESEFIDIGIPDDYFRFCRWIELEKSVPL